jgi:hypothetical protein
MTRYAKRKKDKNELVRMPAFGDPAISFTERPTTLTPGPPSRIAGRLLAFPPPRLCLRARLLSITHISIDLSDFLMPPKKVLDTDNSLG